MLTRFPPHLVKLAQFPRLPDILASKPSSPRRRGPRKYLTYPMDLKMPGLLRRCAPRNDEENNVIASEAKQSRNKVFSRTLSIEAKLLCFLFLLVSPSLCTGQILDQLGNSKDESPVIIDAEKSVVCDETAHKCVATGLAKAQRGTSTVYGDVLTVYFTEGKDRSITAITAEGHVRMQTPTEQAFGEHAHYDVTLDRVLMTGGNLRIVTPKETLTARDSIEYWHTENKGIARGNAIAQFPEKEQLVQANTLVAYFKPTSEKETAKTEEGKEKLEIDRIEAEGNVLASGPKGVVTGERGIYLGKSDIVEIFNNVKITQEGNVIEGGYARVNLKTNVAEMYTHSPHASPTGPHKRISGIIIPKDAKKMKPSIKKKQTHSPQSE
jgi:lipopolysaccharide export system protein LptA